MEIKSYANFGYGGSIITVDVDLRNGLPGIDMIGLSKDQIPLARHFLEQATINSQLAMPSERVLIAFRPCDIRKVDVGQDLAVALAVQTRLNPEQFPDQTVFVMGKLMPDGSVIQRQGMEAGIMSALDDGISTFIVPHQFKFDFPSKCQILRVDTLTNAIELCKDINNYQLAREKENEIANEVEPNLTTIKFNDNNIKEEIFKDLVEQHTDIVKMIEVAVAGKHNLLLTGHPSCCNSTIIETLVPALTPLLTEEEESIVKRIESIAGVDPQERTANRISPFRRVHASISLEGMIGGGYTCMPGEVSLAHNGTLFLDKAHEFRTSCILSLLPPIDKGNILFTRSGRSIQYPSSFQLMMTMPPSPDGNYLVDGKSSLDSRHTVSLMWSKISAPLLERIELKQFMDNDNNTRYDSKELTLEKMRERISRAYEIQRQNGTYNSRLKDYEVNACNIDKKAMTMLASFKKNLLSERETINLIKVSLTIANMDGRQKIMTEDLADAINLTTNRKMKELLMPVIEPFNHRVENKFYNYLSEQVDLYPKQDILRAAAKTLSFFNKDEKSIIKRFLKERSVMDHESLEKILMKGLEGRKICEIVKTKSRNINVGRER